MALNVQFVYTPTADPTCPWGSLHMLKGFLEDNTDHNVIVRDLNIEWLEYLRSKPQLKMISEKIQSKLDYFHKKESLTAREQFSYYRLLNPIEAPSYESLSHAFAIMKSNEDFYDKDKYYDALSTMKQWEQSLSRITYPGVFDKFSRYGFGPYRNPTSCKDIIDDASDAELGFFKSFLNDIYYPTIVDNPPDVIGISIPFRFQFWHSVAYARFIKDKFPNTKIVVGGTALQIFKYARLSNRTDDLLEFCKLFDAIIVGEGETPLLKLLKAWEQGETDLVDRKVKGKPFTRISNLVVYDAITNKVAQPRFFEYHDLNDLSCPTYDDCRWDLYLAPEPVLTYSPTRGCYWDRCVFCEIGLSADRPTSPSRERNYDLVIEDLKKLRKTGRHIYWSVDAIRPAWMINISKEIVKANLDIKWGAEIRLDRKYTEEDAKILKDGGCLVISAGIETGSDRLLKLMDKGTSIDRYNIILDRFNDVGIGVYPMTFIGFPTETIPEAHDTLDYLLSKKDRFSMIAMPATFYLEGNAIITKNPDQFELKKLSKFTNLEAANGWYWESSNEWKSKEQSELMTRLNSVSTQIMGFLDRPFLGGVDTPHSALYIDRHGIDIIKDVGHHYKQRLQEEKDLVNNISVISPFDLETIKENIWTLVDMLESSYQNLECPNKEIMDQCLEDLPSLNRMVDSKPQTYISSALSPLDQWLDINFSRDQAREEPMYTQFRPSKSGELEVLKA